MLRLVRPRRAVAASAVKAGGTGGSTNGGGTNGDGTNGAARRPLRRRRAQCMLLLHTTWLAGLTLLTLANIQGRQQRAQELAHSLLAAAGTSGVPPAGPPLRRPRAFASARACGEALQLPQVALLFLVKGPMHHEALWRLWFESAAGLLPTDALAAALCSSNSSSGGERRRRVLRACSADSGEEGAVEATHDELGGEEAPPPGGGRLLQRARVSVTTTVSVSSSTGVGGASLAGARRRDSAGAAAARGSTRIGSSAAGGNAGAAHASQGLPPASGVLGDQVLFDVYVHPHPSFKGYGEGSVFHGRELPQAERVVTEWGQHSLVDAARALLRAAHRNPRATKFVLLSESDLPLYGPHVLYTQLVHEPLSRMNACNTTHGWRLFDHRWVPRMETAVLKFQHWRKSWQACRRRRAGAGAGAGGGLGPRARRAAACPAGGGAGVAASLAGDQHAAHARPPRRWPQWFALGRRHVDLVLADTAVDASFRAHCRTMVEAERGGEERECYSDEHYIPTLLAVHGRDNETDCQGWLMDTDWSRVSHISPHPWEYPPGEVTDRLLHRLRHPELAECRHAAHAANSARGAFASAGDLAAVAGAAAGTPQAAAALARTCRSLGERAARHAARHRPLGARCRLVARKFLNATAAAALAAAAPCDSRALVLNNGTCPGETRVQAALRRAWQRGAPLALLALGSVLLPMLAALCLAAVATPGAAARQRLGARR